MELENELPLPGAIPEPSMEAQPLMRQRERPMLLVNSAGRVLVVAFLLGWSVDALFYGKPLGISVLIFTLLLIGALFALGRVEGVRPAWSNLWIVLPLLFFAGMVAVRGNGWLTFLNVSATLTLLALLAYFYAGGRVERLGLFGYPMAILKSLAHALVLPAPLLSAGADTVRARESSALRVLPLLRGLFIAIPVLMVFIILMASADMIFEQYLRDAFKLHIFDNLGETLWRVTLVLTAAWLLSGGLYYALSRKARGDASAQEDEPPPGSIPPARVMGATEAAMVLALVNALFLVFAWIQVVYVFSGEAARSMHFEDYREYVRRGFGELLIIAVLTMVLILGLRWLVRSETTKQDLLFNGLSTLLIALAVLVLVSAFQRTLAWESVQYYINTPLRLYVRSFMVWLGLLFGWLALTLWLSRYRERFAIGAFVAALGCLITINLVNPDANVAAYNLTRKDELSYKYVNLLSEDAIPTLVAGLDQTTGEVHGRLMGELASRLNSMERDTGWQSWQSFHLARWDAYNALVQNRAKLGR